MLQIETEMDAIKENIIRLKNDVLYGYTDKLKAAALFKKFEDELQRLNDEMIQYIEKAEDNEDNHAKQLAMLLSEYDQNMIIYKGKLKQSEKSLQKQKQKLVQESVRISMYLTNLAHQIKEVRNIKK